MKVLERERGLPALLGQTVVPAEDTVGQRLCRMRDPEKEQKGLVGPGKVPDAVNREILSRDGVEEYALDPDASFVEAEKEAARCIRT